MSFSWDGNAAEIALRLLGDPEDVEGAEWRFSQKDDGLGRRSLSVNVEKGIWHDHALNEGGGMAALVARVSGQSAGRWLAAQGMDAPGWTPPQRDAPPARTGKTDGFDPTAFLSRTADPVDTPVEAWLVLRGVWSVDRLLPPSVRWLHGAPKDVPDAVGRGVFVYANTAGMPVSVEVQPLTDGGGRLGIRKRWGPNEGVFVAADGVAGGGVVVAEGLADALGIASVSEPDVRVIGVGGTGGLKRLTPEMLNGERGVVLAADGETVGEAAVFKAARLLRDEGLTVKVRLSPEGRDPADLVAANEAGDRYIPPAVECDPAFIPRPTDGGGVVASGGAAVPLSPSPPASQPEPPPAPPPSIAPLPVPVAETVAVPAAPDGMSLLFLDFETLWESSKGKVPAYSITSLGLEAYVRHEEFGIHCLAFARDGEPVEVVEAGEVAERLAAIDWTRTVLVAHNAQFECFVLKTHFGIVPARVVCTLTLARGIWPCESDPEARSEHGAYSLGSLCRRRGYGVKGDALHLSDGVRTPGLFLFPDDYEELKAYCRQDVELCRRLYADLYRLLVERDEAAGRGGVLVETELDAMDAVVRISSEPWLRWREEAYRPVDRSNYDQLLRKPEYLAEKLRALGVEPEVKKEDKTAKGKVVRTYSFSKRDKWFRGLLEHGNPEVQGLVLQRIAVMAMDEEKRAERLRAMGSRGAVPMLLNGNAAITGRDTASGGINSQNWPRGSSLRDALVAPDGYVLVAADLSQIECRVNMAISGQWDVVEAFREGRDLYSELASSVYGKPVSKGDRERQVGKVAVLAAGYGLGAAKFAEQLACDEMNPIVLEHREAKDVIEEYRATNAEATKWRNECDKVVKQLHAPQRVGGVEWRSRGGVVLRRGTGWIQLPSGRVLRYPNLRWGTDEDGREGWLYDAGREKGKKVYGGKIVADITQASARDVLFEAASRLRTRLQGQLRLVHRIHDELVFSVPEVMVEAAVETIREEMTKPPAWLPRLPVDVDVGVGRSWGGAK